MENARSHIPRAEPEFWGREEQFALNALRWNCISGDPLVDRLDGQFADYLDMPFAVLTSNGTTAIQAASLALDVQIGDENICPGFAFTAAANVTLREGASPVFVDVDLETWCITAETIAAAIKARAVGVIAVHTYGNMYDLQPILDLAHKQGLWVLVDAAESFGLILWRLPSGDGVGYCYLYRTCDKDGYDRGGRCRGHA